MAEMHISPFSEFMFLAVGGEVFLIIRRLAFIYLYLTLSTLKLEACRVSHNEKRKQDRLEECCKREGKLRDRRKQEVDLLGA